MTVIEVSLRTAEFADARHDMATWGAPIIADRIQEFYFATLAGDLRRILPLAMLHRLFWRTLLQGDAAQIVRVHAELVLVAEGAGIERIDLERIDIVILDELMNIVMSRFHRSPGTASDYGMTLLRTAANLTEVRLLAA